MCFARPLPIITRLLSFGGYASNGAYSLRLLCLVIAGSLRFFGCGPFFIFIFCNRDNLVAFLPGFGRGFLAWSQFFKILWCPCVSK